MAVKKAPAGTVRKVLRRIKRYRVSLAASILLAAATVAGTLYVPILVGSAIDLMVGPGNVDYAGIASLLTAIGALIALTAAAQWVMNMLNNRITYHVVRDVRAEAFGKLEILPLAYLDSHPTGGIVSRVISDADQFADGLLMGFTQFFTGVVTIIGTLVFMLTINWMIALVVVCLTPLSLFAAKFIASRTYSMFKAQSETRGEQTALIDEMIGNQKVVQAFCYGKKSMERFDEVNDRLEKVSLRAVFFSSLTNPVTRFVNNIVYACVALTGAFAALGVAFTTDEAFTVGALTVLLSYANQYTKPFNEISGVVTELQNALACAARLFELIDEKPETPDADTSAPDASDTDQGKAASAPDAVRGEVELRDVSFSYDKSKELIKDFNLAVSPGERVAIVGPTGCGKTTLINLLMRFYDADSGEILVDGRDIRSMPRRELRARYGMVLQDTWLRSGTIRDNIAMGRPDATEDEIVAAAKASHADSFIRKLPNGYDTVIAEDGGELSQGQKQLLCISRVMLALPPTLILDEATSSIDTRTELKIQSAFERLMSGRTSFIVAHRLSTIRGADVILVMRDGKIVEQGRHEELLARGGFYAKLYNSQFESVV